MIIEEDPGVSHGKIYCDVGADMLMLDEVVGEVGGETPGETKVRECGEGVVEGIGKTSLLCER